MINFYLKRISFFSFFIFSLSNLRAQSTDFATWSAIEINHPFNKKTDFRFTEQLRLNNGSSSYKVSYSDFGLSYKISKHFSVAANYRLNITPIDLQHRFYADVSISQKINKLSGSFRLRFQKQFEIANNPTNYLRPKFSFKYKLSKQIVPYTAFESGYRIYNKGNRFDFYRIYLGSSFNLNKFMSMDLYYLLSGEFNVNDPSTAHIAGLTLAFDL